MATAQPPQPAPPEVQPIPPRYWWAKRIAIFVAVIITGLAGLRWWWGYEVGRRFQAEIDRYRAAGQPVFPEDFDQPPIPDTENAALVLKQASEALSHLTPEQTELYNGWYNSEQLIAECPGDVAELLKATVEARALVRKARSMSRADWGLPLRSPLVLPVWVVHTPRRDLARLLHLTAAYSHHTGDDAAAVEALRDILAMATHVSRRPTIVSHLTALAMRSVAVAHVEDTVSRLRIFDDARSQSVSVRPASRAQVHRLVAELINEGGVERRLGFTWICYGSRARDIDTAERVAAGAGYSLNSGFAILDSPVNFLLRPFHRQETVRDMRALTDWAKVGERLTWPDWAPRSDRPVARSASSSAPWPFRRMLFPSGANPYHSFATQHFRAVAWHRMAAVALAIRMHELDRGRRLARLDDLVPQYLPSIPRDPFAHDDRGIGYMPDLKPPVLYSVNLDGVDDRGIFATFPEGDVNWLAKDLPFFLNGDRPRGESSTSASQPASSQRAEDQNDVGDRQDHAAGDQHGKGDPHDRQE